MTRRFLLLALIFVAWSGLPASAADFVTSVVDPYLRIQTALAADRLDGVTADAAAIVKGAGAMGAPGAAIKAAAAALQSASSLAAAREAFGTLSDAIIAHARSTKAPLGTGTRKAYCPMEKQYWLQKSDTIANPYAGKRMLRCGEFQAL